LPLKGYAQDLLFIDTLDIQLDLDEYDEIDSLEFKLFTANGFPMSAEGQIIFLDENGVALDSLFTQQLPIITSAPIDSQGEVTGKSENTVFATLDNERSQNLEGAEQIAFRVLANTTDSQNETFVRFQDTNNMDVRVGVKIFGNVEL
ncbi:MAG: hypothetical protein HRT74_09735, partial [Flavobacteriales bacterium]|nr:hypothetical protein [Flavobacteriales bacterium]